jgi:hypothetical protein
MSNLRGLDGEPGPFLFLLFDPAIIVFVFGHKVAKKTTNTLAYFGIGLITNANFQRIGQLTLSMPLFNI